MESFSSRFYLAFNDEHSRKRKVKNIEKISSRAPSKPDSNLFVSAKWFHHLSAYSNILFIFYENTFCLSIDSVRCHSITQPAKGKKMFSLKESYTGVDVNIGWSRRRGEKVNEKWFKFRCLFHSVCVFLSCTLFSFVFFIINSFPFHPFFNIVLKCLDLFAISSTHNLLKLPEIPFFARLDTSLIDFFFKMQQAKRDQKTFFTTTPNTSQYPVYITSVSCSTLDENLTIGGPEKEFTWIMSMAKKEN